MNVAQVSLGQMKDTPDQDGSNFWGRVSCLVRDCGLAILVAWSMLAVGGCGQGPPASDYGVWFVHFSITTSYEDALRLVTDVGLQLGHECQNATFIETHGTSVVEWAPWTSESQRQDYEYYVGQAVSPFLVVRPTPLAPSDWSDRLLKMQGVQSVKGIQGPVACSGGIYSQTPPAGNVNDLLPPNQTGTYAQITFDEKPIPSYADAVDSVLNLGLRLADPCFEQALAKGKTPVWHVMGQENAFASSHILLVATTSLTGNLWQEQVQAIPASVRVDTDATNNC